MPSDKLCKDCSFYRGSLICANAKALPFTKMVDGFTHPEITAYGGVNAMTCRLAQAMCGPDAKWWRGVGWKEPEDDARAP